MKKWFLLLGITAVFWACQNVNDHSGKPKIVCTTGMLGDATYRLVGDSAEIHTLMGPGVDPHLYKATQGDIEKLSAANVIIYNGLHLEGKMTEIFAKLQKQKTVIAVGELLPESELLNSSDYQGAYDPHIWMDVSLWARAMGALADQLMEALPHCAERIAENQEKYLEELETLHRETYNTMSQIPDDQRVLVTAHDAFKYFGRAYDVKVRGLQGISTTAEYGLRDVTALVEYISTNRIKAIFVESSVPPRSIQAVMEGCRSRGHEVKLGGELFSDAMGEAGSEAATYTGMIQHNVYTISSALK